jgi:hypothetical protein
VREYLTALAVAIGLAVCLYGCGPRDCFVPVAIVPPQQFGIVFDSCRGGYFYQTLPPMPGEAEVAPNQNPKVPL